MTDFKIGDEIYHKSDPSIIWIIERINENENEIYCSKVVKETLEKKEISFSINSIAKRVIPTIIFNKRSRRSDW